VGYTISAYGTANGGCEHERKLFRIMSIEQKTALMLASDEGHTDIVRMLLDQRAGFCRKFSLEGCSAMLFP